MESKLEALVKLRLSFSARQHFLSIPPKSARNLGLIWTRATTYSTECPNQDRIGGEGLLDHPKDSKEVFERWGCTDSDIAKIFIKGPSLCKADVNQLQNKLTLLKDLGITAPDLVKIINCRPRFLSCRINRNFDERITFFMTLFESKQVLLKAVVRNPSLLTYDLHKSIKPGIALYEEMGVSKKDFMLVLVSRPTLIPRTSFDDEKMEYIRRTGLSKDAKMYKHVVAIIGISRLETIRQKVANLEKFGFTEDEVLRFMGRAPLVLTLSVDKVQRNMTFILCALKLPATVVLKHPFLLFFNLEVVLRPRVLLSGKMQEMGIELSIKGPKMLRALRMSEERFLKVYVRSQPKDVADELMEFYLNAKGIKRLAGTSKKNFHRGFPF